MSLPHPQLDTDRAEERQRRAADEQLRDLLAKARRGDRSVLPELRRQLDRHPEIWRDASDLVGPAITAWIDLAAGDNLLIRESLERRMAEMRRSLLADDERPLVVLHVEYCLVSWASVQAFQRLAAEALPHGGSYAAQMSKQLDSADRQYQRALKQLLEVQRRAPAASTRSTPKHATSEPTALAAVTSSPIASEPSTAELQFVPAWPPPKEPDPPDTVSWDVTDEQVAKFANELSEDPEFKHLVEQSPDKPALRIAQ